MAIIFVIQCLVGAMAGSALPTEKNASRAPNAVTLPVASAQQNAVLTRTLSCHAHSRYRDLSLPAAAQPTQLAIELCHEP